MKLACHLFRLSLLFGGLYEIIGYKTVSPYFIKTRYKCFSIVGKLSEFLTAIEHDPRINAIHISIYAALVKQWHEHQYKNPVSVFSHEVMKLSKISGSATYHKS